MVKQISLDAWQIQYLTGLLRKGSEIVDKTNTPTVLYRHTIEEDENSYEEIVCTLSSNYVIEQLVTSGGPVVPNFNQQFVFTIEDYPERLMKKSKELFLQVVSLLENQLK
ncbi:MAG: hypothetical protein NPMRTH4_480004 [Nitrosopumilales archaeon]|nr:MAG: hypothetical protein NPMRTH4_480004 [Nitrosopumilales archaeon]